MKSTLIIISAVTAFLAMLAVPAPADSQVGPLAAPSITIVVDSIPNTSQDFSFTGCLGSGCSTFSLDDDDDPALPRTVTGSGLPPGTYTITQDAVAEWTLVDVSCDTGEDTDPVTRTATITLSAGEDVTCTFINRAPAIRIVQDDPTGGGNDFAYTGCQGAGCSSFSLDDDADGTLPDTVTGVPVAPGVYEITQVADGRYPLTDIECSTDEAVDLPNRRVVIDLEANEFAVCTFSNTTQSITVVQDTEPNGPQDFSFSGCAGASCTPFSLDDDGDGALPNTVVGTEVPPGTYTITQDVVAGHQLTGLSCSPTESTSVVTRTATITLAAGEHVTCTFVDRSSALAPISQITSGHLQGCAVVPAGQVRCWGENEAGQLGDDTTIDRHVPVAVTNTDGTGPLTGVTQVDTAGQASSSTAASRLGRTCARLADGQARCWGRSGSNPLTRPVVVLNSAGTGPLLGVSEIGTGPAHSCARLTRQVKCWGSLSTSLPESVLDTDGAGPLTGVAQLSVGFSHSCALLTSGQVRCWGSNNRGELGNGTFTARSRATVVQNPAGTGPLTGVTEVSAGSNLSCARLSSGEARCWGALPGDGSAQQVRPVAVRDATGTAPLTGIADLSAGGGYGPFNNQGDSPFRSACVVLTNGQVQCWGQTPNTATFPTTIANSEGTGPLADVAEVVVGGAGTCALLTNGQGRCWGFNPGGGLTPGPSPVTVLVY